MIIDEILSIVKTLAKVSNTTIYDDEIKIFIQTQYHMLEQTGIPQPTDASTDEYLNAYATAIGYYYVMSFDEGVNDTELRFRYHEILELLRVGVLYDTQ